MPGDETHRLLQKLVRESARSEAQAVEHPLREGKRIGPVPPLLALQAIADHALAMQERIKAMLEGHGLAVALPRGGLSAALVSLRHLVVDRVSDPERAYRTAILDLRHGLEVVRLLRELARRELLFGIIRWCDDWLGARRTLVARAEAQLAWFAEQQAMLDDLATVEDIEDDFEPSALPTETDRY